MPSLPKSKGKKISRDPKIAKGWEVKITPPSSQKVVEWSDIQELNIAMQYTGQVNLSKNGNAKVIKNNASQANNSAKKSGAHKFAASTISAPPRTGFIQKRSF